MTTGRINQVFQTLAVNGQSWTAARWRRRTAAALATTDGQAAAHGSSIAALQSSLTTGLSNKADQSAFDVLEGVVATRLQQLFDVEAKQYKRPHMNEDLSWASRQTTLQERSGSS